MVDEVNNVKVQSYMMWVKVANQDIHMELDPEDYLRSSLL